MLRIIIGRSGSGKSQKCITEFNAYVQKNKSIHKASFLFVPEQYNMITERRLLEYQISENFDIKGLIGHEVLNFKRFVHRILSIYGHKDNVMLNECGKIMLMTSIINDIKSQLKFYNNITERYTEISRILSLIDEFAKYDVTYKQLREITTGDYYFDKKLHDLSFIYENYELIKKDKYSDDNDSFKIMLKLVEENLFFKNRSVWIDSFTGFTAQEIELIKLMVLQCENVTISLCTDNSGEPAFESIDNTLNSLKTLADDLGSQFTIENLSLNSDSNKYKYLNKSLFLLQQNISKIKIDNQYTSNDIYLTECESVFDEVTNCALKIQKLHSDLSIPYKNIAVALRDLTVYDVIIKSVFQKFDIPFYIDDKKSIENNPVIKTILSLLAIISDDWQINDVLECIKSNVLPFVRDKDYIENVILSLGLRGKKSYQTCDNNDILNIYNEIYSLSVTLDRAKDIKDACVILCSYFQKWGIQNRLEQLAEDIEDDYPDIKNEYSRIWNILLEVIEQIVTFLGDTKCDNSKKTSETLRKLLTSGFSQYRIGFLPARIDSVQVISIERSRSSNIKALFVLGANESVLPSNLTDNGILKDQERDTLSKFNINLADSNEFKASKENFYIYTILSLPSDILEISWPLEDVTGKSIKPSHVILRKIKKLFPKISINYFKKSLNSSELYTQKSPSLEKAINNEVNSNLFNLNGNLTTSVSRIENYYKCPYSFLMTYGLKLKSRDEAEIIQKDIGNLIHALAEKVFSEIMALPNDATLSDFERLVDKAYKTIYENMSFSRYNISQRENFLLNRVKGYASKSFMYIKKQIISGTFNVQDIEASFNYDENSTLKPIVIIPKDKSEYLNSVNIIGRIDRFDVFEDEDGKQYVRVVDYKTSSSQSKISEDDVKNGVALQLITYLNAIINTLSDKKTTLPAAALYYTFDDDIDIVSNHVSFLKLTDSLKEKKYSMNGYVLDDEYIIEKMTGGNKNIINNNKVKTYDEFVELKNIVYDNIEKASVNISKGKYPISPYSNKDYIICDSCKMRSICANCSNLLDESNS